MTMQLPMVIDLLRTEKVKVREIQNVSKLEVEAMRVFYLAIVPRSILKMETNRKRIYEHMSNFAKK